MDSPIPVVAVTHYMPLPELVHPKYSGSKLNWCFANKHRELFNGEISAWVCGHSHSSSVHHVINGTDICMVPLGYPGENVFRYDLPNGINIGICEV